jgi:anti-sigma B factor antagonist
MGLLSTHDRGNGRQLLIVEERRLDAEVSQLFREETASLPNPDTTELHLDLSQVDFIDTSGIGALLNLQRRCQENHVALTLHQPTNSVNAVFRILRLHHLLVIDPHPME